MTWFKLTFQWVSDRYLSRRRERSCDLWRIVWKRAPLHLMDFTNANMIVENVELPWFEPSFGQPLHICDSFLSSGIKGANKPGSGKWFQIMWGGGRNHIPSKPYKVFRLFVSIFLVNHSLVATASASKSLKSLSNFWSCEALEPLLGNMSKNSRMARLKKLFVAYPAVGCCWFGKLGEPGFSLELQTWWSYPIPEMESEHSKRTNMTAIITPKIPQSHPPPSTPKLHNPTPGFVKSYFNSTIVVLVAVSASSLWNGLKTKFKFVKLSKSHGLGGMMCRWSSE